MFFEELHGEEGNGLNCVNLLNINVQQSQKAPVLVVVGSLETEGFQRHRIEVFNGKILQFFKNQVPLLLVSHLLLKYFLIEIRLVASRLNCKFSPKTYFKMKKLSFFLFLFFAANLMHSQITLSPNFGTNISTVRFKNSSMAKTKPVFRYFAGLQASHDISKNIALGLGLQYATKGYLNDEKQVQVANEARYKYIDIMPFVEYHLNEKFGLLAGIGVGFTLDEEYKINEDWNPPVVDIINPLEFAGMVGFKYTLGNIFVNLRYQQSLATISDLHFTDENGDEITNAKHLNQNLLLGVGYNFHLKKK